AHPPALPAGVMMANAGRIVVQLRAVGGQNLTSMVAMLARRLTPHARSLTVREMHGMAQRGGVVSATLDFSPEVAEPAGAGGSRPTTVLVALELTEGARVLPKLEAGDRAFIATCVIRPPGSWGPQRPTWPTQAELEGVA